VKANASVAPVVAALPASRPFIAPEELERTSGRTDLLRLGANESAFGPSSGALAAMRAALERVAWYGDPESFDLRAALARALGCGSEHIVCGAGIDDLLALAVRVFLSPGDAAVTTLGCYPTFAYHVAGYGARLVTVPYAADGTLQLRELARAAAASRARLVYLANPDNPSGSFVSAGALATFRAALPPDCTLLLDEAYAEFAPDEGIPPFDSRDPGIVRTRTFSKAYGLAGARIGYAYAHAEIVTAFNKIRNQYAVNRVAQAGALAALADRNHVAQVVRETAAGRAEYRALAASHGLATLPSLANFVCVDLGSRERAEATVESLLRRGVFVRKPGAPPLDGYIRVTVGTADERARFAGAFSEALAEFAAKPAQR